MKELKTDNFLKRGLYKYEYRQFVPFTEIDIKASKENPARLTRAIDDDKVTKYGVEMLDGVEFGAIVLLNLPPGGQYKWIIAGGVHRSCAAIEALKKGFDAYCITEPDEYRRDVLYKQLNTLEGTGVSIAEQIRLVIDIHIKHGIAIKQLAKEWSLKPNALFSALSDHRACQRGMMHNWDFKKLRIPARMYTALNRIHSDVTYNNAVSCAMSHRLITSQTVEDMVTEVIKSKSESDAAKIISRYQKDAIDSEARSSARHGKLPQQPANKMLSDAKRFIKHLDKGIDALFLASLTDRRRAMDILEQLIDSAKDVKAALFHIDQIDPSSQAAE
jgi:hypothetical protein